MSSQFIAPAVPLPADGVFWRCLCGAPIYEHGRYNADGNQVWAGCGATGCERYRASDGSAWPSLYAGATVDEPTDLDRDTDHWVGGRVLLTGDEPPL